MDCKLKNRYKLSTNVCLPSIVSPPGSNLDCANVLLEIHWLYIACSSIWSFTFLRFVQTQNFRWNSAGTKLSKPLLRKLNHTLVWIQQVFHSLSLNTGKSGNQKSVEIYTRNKYLESLWASSSQVTLDKNVTTDSECSTVALFIHLTFWNIL